jgi:hypothetical protein
MTHIAIAEVQLLQSLIDALPYAAQVRDSQGRLMTCNSYYLEQQHAALEALQGKRFNDTQGPPSEERQWVHEALMCAIHAAAPYCRDVTTELHGKTRMLRHWGKPHYDSQGRLLGMIFASLDVTDRDELVPGIEIVTEPQTLSVPIDVSQLKATFGSGQREQLDLREIVAAAVASFQVEAHSRGLSVALDLDAAREPSVWANAPMLQHTLKALLTHGLHLLRSGQLMVRLTTTAQCLEMIAVQCDVLVVPDEGDILQTAPEAAELEWALARALVEQARGALHRHPEDEGKARLSLTLTLVQATSLSPV